VTAREDFRVPLKKPVLAFHQNLLHAEQASEIGALGRDPTSSGAFGNGCQLFGVHSRMAGNGGGRKPGSWNDPVGQQVTWPTFLNDTRATGRFTSPRMDRTTDSVNFRKMREVETESCTPWQIPCEGGQLRKVIDRSSDQG